MVGLTVAIAYVLHKTTFVFPIIGGRKVENLLENIEALDIALTDEHLKFLDSVAPLDLGFPHNMIVSIALLHYRITLFTWLLPPPGKWIGHSYFQQRERAPCLLARCQAYLSRQIVVRFVCLDGPPLYRNKVLTTRLIFAPEFPRTKYLLKVDTKLECPRTLQEPHATFNTYKMHTTKETPICTLHNSVCTCSLLPYSACHNSVELFIIFQPQRSMDNRC